MNSFELKFKVTAGSEFQKKIAYDVIKALAVALKQGIESKHKSNKVDWSITK